ncbi:MAG: carboxypeptidase-like regulatory domain-containing protein, partial [Bacteroidetes bacterium]|nr:carboxypeptidase-like regulatory domain-containing protein [Bacteroidota bacterium]
GQSVLVYGKIIDEKTELPLPFAKVQFAYSKKAALADSAGNYKITYSNDKDSDSIIASFIGYHSSSQLIEKIQSSQSADNRLNINFKLKSIFKDFDEITVKAPDELPSTILIRKVIANKDNNNKNKLDAYEYKLYNKIQFDLNNIGDDFKSNKLVNKLDLVFNYLDSTEKGQSFLPLILSESISRYYYKDRPKTKREIIEASRTTGIENIQVTQFLGDMYLELNVYDNIYTIFGKSFVSPLSNNCQNYYKYYLEDSAYIDNDWCYKLRYIPKRKRDLCFTGNLWINDSSFAVKRIEATVSPNANLNFVKDFYFQHDFEKVQNAFWMLKKERFIADIQLNK